MTITVNLVPVANSISKLPVPGVSIRDIDNIPMDASKSGPIMYPLPNGFITNMQFSRITLGSDGTAKMDLSYTLNYRFLYIKAGARLNTLSAYGELVAMLTAILVAIFTDDTISGAVDMTLENVSNIGALPDVSEQTTYYGVDIALRVLEFAQ